MPLSLGDQSSLILKVISSDDDLRKRPDAELRLGVVFLPAVAESTAAKDELLAALPTTKAAGHTLRGIPLPVTSGDALQRSVAGDKIHILYLTPGLESILADALRISAAQRVLTVSGVPEYGNHGVTVIFLAGRKLVVNRRSAQREGREFDASFLEYVQLR